MAKVKSDLSLAAASVGEPREQELEAAIGNQVRQFRHELNMTVGEVAKLAGLSVSMLSKIEFT